MKRLINVVIVILLSVSPAMSDDFISKYSNDEVLEYTFSYRSQYYDGSGVKAADGIETDYIYVDEVYSGMPNDGFKIVTIMDANGTNASTSNYYFYDENGSIIHYLTTDSRYYVNQADSPYGAMVIPYALSPGYSWKNHHVLREFNGEMYSGYMTYTVIKEESVRVPYGAIDSYQITYTGAFDRGSNLLTGPGKGLTSNGTLWVNPEIGIVKQSENGVIGGWYSQDYTMTKELTNSTVSPSVTPGGGGGGGGCFIKSLLTQPK